MESGVRHKAAHATALRLRTQMMRERNPDGCRRFRLGVRIALGGLLAGLVLLFVFDVVTDGHPADLDALSSESVWSEAPPGADEVLSVLGSRNCDGMGDAVDLAQQIEVPDW